MAKREVTEGKREIDLSKAGNQGWYDGIAGDVLAPKRELDKNVAKENTVQPWYRNPSKGR